MKRGLGLRRQIIDGDCCYLTILFFASVRRTLLKKTHTKERSHHANSENCNIQLGSYKKKQFNSKQIIEILQPIIIDNFSTHSNKVDISQIDSCTIDGNV